MTPEKNKLEYKFKSTAELLYPNKVVYGADGEPHDNSEIYRDCFIKGCNFGYRVCKAEFLKIYQKLQEKYTGINTEDYDVSIEKYFSNKKRRLKNNTTIYAKCIKTTDPFSNKDIGLIKNCKYEVGKIEMGQSITYVILKDISGLYNSLCFEFFENGKQIDIYTDPRFNPYV